MCQVCWKDVLAGDILLSFADEAGQEFMSRCCPYPFFDEAFPADVLLVRAAGGQAAVDFGNLGNGQITGIHQLG